MTYNIHNLKSFYARKKFVREYKKFAIHYREYPDKFVRDFFGIKLLPFQKLMLRMMRS